MYFFNDILFSRNPYHLMNPQLCKSQATRRLRVNLRQLKAKLRPSKANLRLLKAEWRPLRAKWRPRKAKLSLLKAAIKQQLKFQSSFKRFVTIFDKLRSEEKFAGLN